MLIATMSVFIFSDNTDGIVLANVFICFRMKFNEWDSIRFFFEDKLDVLQEGRLLKKATV